MKDLSLKYCMYPFRTAKSHRTINCRPVVSYATEIRNLWTSFCPNSLPGLNTPSTHSLVAVANKPKINESK
jgi:hypothetical protein